MPEPDDLLIPPVCFFRQGIHHAKVAFWARVMTLSTSVTTRSHFWPQDRFNLSAGHANLNDVERRYKPTQQICCHAYQHEQCPGQSPTIAAAA